MYALRCTGRLLARLKVTPARTVVDPTTRLGDWYATVLQAGRTPLVLALSDRTLLPVVLPARDLSHVPQHLADAVRQVLIALGAPADAIEHEHAAMNDPVIAPTASHRVLGSMSDLIRMLKPARTSHPEMSLLDLALDLAKAPCGPLGMAPPNVVTLDALRGRELPRIA